MIGANVYLITNLNQLATLLPVCRYQLEVILFAFFFAPSPKAHLQSNSSGCTRVPQGVGSGQMRMPTYAFLYPPGRTLICLASGGPEQILWRPGVQKRLAIMDGSILLRHYEIIILRACLWGATCSLVEVKIQCQWIYLCNVCRCSS